MGLDHIFYNSFER